MSSVMGPGPVPKAYNAGFPPDSFAIRNPATRDFNNMRNNRPAATSAGPPYSQGQRPNRMPQQGMHVGHHNQMQRPSNDRQRPSSSGSSSGSTFMSRESYDARMASASSSRSSFTSFDSLDLGPRKPDNGWQRPTPIKQNRFRRNPGELFATLPDEVLEIILDSLKKLHLEPKSDSCATCMMRDLCSVAVASRRFLGFARAALYQDIQLIGPDSQVQKKRYKLSHGVRLVLLRRTLRSKPQIAALVHSLKVPAAPVEIPLDKYQSLVASVIMACPNFERLVGFHQEYDHSFNRLFYALSTREQLNEMTWVVKAAPSQQQQQQQQQRRPSQSNAKSSLGSMGMLNPGNAQHHHESPEDLDPDQSAQFLEMHVNWSQLTSLTIHCLPGATLAPVSLLGTMMAHLPALQDLHLSRLPPTAFSDTNLLSLPPLRALSLSDLCGISDAGLAAFARRPSSLPIRSLTLRHVNVGSLPVLGRLLSHLTSLESFALAQAAPPVLPDGEVIWLFPYLASAGLRRLHWDVTGPTARASPADAILARSIAAGGFPALRALRAPNDPEGLFQGLCKPEECIEEASGDDNRHRGTGGGGGLIARAGSSKSTASGSGSGESPTPTTSKAPTWSSPLGFMFSSSSSGAEARNQPLREETSPHEQQQQQQQQQPPWPPRSTNLAQARLAAQARLEAARATPRFLVHVVEVDADGAAGAPDSFGLAGFVGEVASRIRYLLRPDAGATDESGGLLEVEDMLSRSGGGGGGGEDSGDRDTKDRDRDREDRCCSGRWNARDIGDKKDRERWWHTERARWGGDVRLS